MTTRMYIGHKLDLFIQIKPTRRIHVLRILHGNKSALQNLFFSLKLLKGDTFFMFSGIRFYIFGSLPAIVLVPNLTVFLSCKIFKRSSILRHCEVKG